MTAPTSRMVVIATAGHVDHGKSTLVKALTGTDPDRWTEEQERGLTIDLGFAFCDLDSGTTLGFVDVPGHVRFLKNMLAGIGAVETVVLVVASGEGWMPQTEEHLRIVELLGISRGLTVLTKADATDEDTVELTRMEIEDRVAGSFLATSPIVVCDAVSGRGIDDLRGALERIVRHTPDAADEGRPRLWVDRVFAPPGVGTVVTGLLTGGALEVGAEVTVGPEEHRARVRGVQCAHRAVQVALPGARVALALAGVGHTDIARGDAVVRPTQWIQPTHVDVALTPLSVAAIPRRARWKAYVGSGEIDADVRVVEETFARLTLSRAAPLAPGDRIILRDPGPDVTVGGAEVLDVAPTVRIRDLAGVLALPLGERVLAGHPMVPAADLERWTGLTASEARRVADGLVSAGRAVRAGGHLVAYDAAAAALERVAGLVGDHHRDHPLDAGVGIHDLAGRLGIPAPVLADLLSSTADFEVEGGLVSFPDHRVEADEDPRARTLLAALDAHPFAPPDGESLGVPTEVVRALERAGRVVVIDGLAFAPRAVSEATERIREALADRESLTVADVRDLLDTTRKYVVPLLRHLDATGITRREGERRVAGARLRDRG